ncbi:hypothetical protein PSTA9_01422 [Pseudomonas syringae pv. tomato]|nr:hypothetical protein PSTA9_01422 [Pseudomonas syringae pv. tomato]
MVPLKIHVWMLINPCFEVWEVIFAVGAFQICIFDNGETGLTAPVDPSVTLSLLNGCRRHGATCDARITLQLGQQKRRYSQGDSTDAEEDLPARRSLHAEASLSRSCFASSS